MMDLHGEQVLRALWGPQHPYSEYKRGDHIRYRHNNSDHTGTVLWVCGPGFVGGQEAGLHYIVEPDRGGVPHVTYPSDVLEA